MLVLVVLILTISGCTSTPTLKSINETTVQYGTPTTLHFVALGLVLPGLLGVLCAKWGTFVLHMGSFDRLLQPQWRHLGSQRAPFGLLAAGKPGGAALLSNSASWTPVLP